MNELFSFDPRVPCGDFISHDGDRMGGVTCNEPLHLDPNWGYRGFVHPRHLFSFYSLFFWPFWWNRGPKGRVAAWHECFNYSRMSRRTYNVEAYLKSLFQWAFIAYFLFIKAFFLRILFFVFFPQISGMSGIENKCDNRSIETWLLCLTPTLRT